MAGTVLSRIVAGRYGGRRLTVPPAGTRPTTDRVRESLFGALTTWAGTADRSPGEALAGWAVLDLYAGSGALGLEAASRGADRVLLVERDRRAAAVARSNVDALAAGEAVRVRAADVARVLAEPADPSFGAYDLVLADPPYELASATLVALLTDLVEHGWLAADGLVVVERSRRTPEPDWPGALAEGWSRAYGETVLYFRTRPEPPSRPSTSTLGA